MHGGTLYTLKTDWFQCILKICVQVEAAEEADLVTASGLRFWSSTVREQNIRDVTHCATILAYLQVGIQF